MSSSSGSGNNVNGTFKLQYYTPVATSNKAAVTLVSCITEVADVHIEGLFFCT
jgi:hypothetical protein